MCYFSRRTPLRLKLHFVISFVCILMTLPVANYISLPCTYKTYIFFHVVIRYERKRFDAIFFYFIFLTPELAVHFVFLLIEIASVVVKGLHMFQWIDWTLYTESCDLCMLCKHLCIQSNFSVSYIFKTKIILACNVIY